MIDPHNSTVEYLLKETATRVEKYASSGNESARADALNQCLKLTRALEKPKDAVLKLSLSPVLFVAVKIGHNLGIFQILVKSGPATAKEMAAAQNADLALVDRILRTLASIGYVQERGAELYAPSPLSYELTQRATIGMMDSLFREWQPAITRGPEFLQITGYQNPEDPWAGPFQQAYETKDAVWEWLEKRPEELARFNPFMEGVRENRQHWVDWFPMQEQVLNGSSGSYDQPLLIDLGGGRGHDIAYFAARFPDVPGRLILEDISPVIDDTQKLDPKIERFKHDLLTPQPIKGARVYYMKWVLHDWSDEKCRVILGHIAAAMKKGYSKLLIEEFVLPNTDAQLLPIMFDMMVMVAGPGMERTRSQWTKLLKSSGLEVKNFWVPNGDSSGFIEVELA
ncbi:S-adenosyl-L-methionine-dependent methyltransferase [Penicillium antarcticum]|uniref:S-adenosyl-L-methionine-dependent methyltransferase n=1 Tax=Penicillium antarcticum TaxID=416450 RepID=UPI0023881D8C|nr:S-adenosyl-L-methionine-dependent methyltransferase [Penicillium antarcticum]KAJ5297875.1 S-adenosyl-L-methionine-dependent methyltransferase [Penicillium antarcticum]